MKERFEEDRLLVSKMGTTSQGEKWSLESGKGKEMHSLPEPSEGNQPANTSIVGPLTSRTVRWYKFVSFKPLHGSDGKESTCNAGDLGSIPGCGRSTGRGTHSSILAWRIAWTEESGRLQSIGSQSRT